MEEKFYEALRTVPYVIIRGAHADDIEKLIYICKRDNIPAPELFHMGDGSDFIKLCSENTKVWYLVTKGRLFTSPPNKECVMVDLHQGAVMGISRRMEG